MAKNSRCKHWWGWLLLLVVLAVIAAVLLYFLKFRGHHSGSGSDDKKYSDALKIAMQFFDVQKAGKLVDNKISWRGDSALDDGKDVKLDLSKGMYEQGNTIWERRRSGGVELKSLDERIAIVEFGETTQKFLCSGWNGIGKENGIEFLGLQEKEEERREKERKEEEEER